jgi:hypothetical protein
MFAPKVAKAKTTAALNSTNGLARPNSTLKAQQHRPFEQALLLQRNIGNHATLRLPAQPTTRRTGDDSNGDHERETYRENTMRGEAPHDVARDFRQVLPSRLDQAHGSLARTSLWRATSAGRHSAEADNRAGQ